MKVGNSSIVKNFEESIRIKEMMLASGELDVIREMGDRSVKVINNGCKMMLCGNGGSAADAQHLAAEMLIRLRPRYNRQGVAAIALAQDTSTITACGNDFGYDRLYERMVESLGKPGDVLIAITTSGNSDNILLALKASRRLGIQTFGFLGSGGGRAVEFCDLAIVVPSETTARIQEAHITSGHALMEYVEDCLIEEGSLVLQV